ncbi:hypothetical protein D3C80_2146310 [compost metagenome]
MLARDQHGSDGEDGLFARIEYFQGQRSAGGGRGGAGGKHGGNKNAADGFGEHDLPSQDDWDDCILRCSIR